MEPIEATRRIIIEYDHRNLPEDDGEPLDVFASIVSSLDYDKVEAVVNEYDMEE